MDTTEENDVILCERDYFDYNSTRFKCHQCNQSIATNEYQIVGIYKYHNHCLHCPGCTITQNNFIDGEQDHSIEKYDYNNRPYCRYHYSLIKGTECIGCGQAVLSTNNHTTSNGGKWHQECFMIMKVKQG